MYGNIEQQLYKYMLNKQISNLLLIETKPISKEYKGVNLIKQYLHDKGNSSFSNQSFFAKSNNKFHPLLQYYP